MPPPVLVDAGPLVALLDGSDRHHGWVVEQFKGLPPSLMTCEAVLAEAIYLLRRFPVAQEAILRWVAKGVLQCVFSLQQEADPVLALWKGYRDVPMSLADACLVRLSELHPGSRVFTVDSDFVVYRSSAGRPIEAILPGR